MHSKTYCGGSNSRRRRRRQLHDVDWDAVSLFLLVLLCWFAVEHPYKNEMRNIPKTTRTILVAFAFSIGQQHHQSRRSYDDQHQGLRKQQRGMIQILESIPMVRRQQQRRRRLGRRGTTWTTFFTQSSGSHSREFDDPEDEKKKMKSSTHFDSNRMDSDDEDDMSQWSITQLLEQLDQFQIRYLPTATRLDLEELWKRRRRIRQEVNTNVNGNRDKFDVMDTDSFSTNSTTASTRNDCIDKEFPMGGTDVKPDCQTYQAQEDIVQNVTSWRMDQEHEDGQDGYVRTDDNPNSEGNVVVDDSDSIRSTFSSTSRTTHPTARNTAFDDLSSMSVIELLKQLDDCNILYPPSATRADLEALLLLKRRQEGKANNRGRHGQTNVEDRQEPPSQKQSSYTGSEDFHLDDSSKIRTSTEEDAKEQLSGKTPAHPISQTYSTSSGPPSKTIRDEDQNASTRMTRNDWNDRQLPQLERRRRRRRLHQERNRPLLRKLWSKTTSATIRLASTNGVVSRGIARIGKTAAAQLNNVAEQAQTFFAFDEEDESDTNDDNGIRDVDFVYTYKYENRNENKNPIDVSTENISNPTPKSPATTTSSGETQGTRSPKRPFSRIPTNDGRTDRGLRNERKGDDEVAPSTGGKSDFRTHEGRRNAQSRRSRPLPRLPAAFAESGQRSSYSPRATSTESSQTPLDERDNPGSQSRRHARSDAAATNRRIYSPYGSEKVDFDGQDAFDRFGNFVANTAENVLWGPEDTSNLPGEDNPRNEVDSGQFREGRHRQHIHRREANEKRKHSEYAGSSRESRAQRNPREATGTKTTRKRHWKDKLAESFDYLLGLHEDGAYYNSWQKQLELNREDEGGNDALSVAQGRTPNLAKRSKYDKPIWEEEGNLISLLFGRTQSGNSLLFERVLDRNSGSLLNLFTAAGRSILIVASYLCRWASVRGALPQSVVVVGVVSAGICTARAKNRLRNMVFTLLALRTLGELIHGYVYGASDWDDDEEEPEDEEADGRL